MQTDQLTIVAIDDDPGDAELLRRQLGQVQTLDIEFLHAASAAEGRKVLAERSVDVIFLDHILGAQTGLELLGQLRADGELCPIIAMTAQGDEYVVRDLMGKGADDYLPKRDLSPDLLRRSIEAATNKFHRRRLAAQNKGLAEDLKRNNEILVQKNRRLAELYETAHEFVDNVSHEFRTPLTVIKEYTSIIRDGLAGEISSEQEEYLETILDRVDDLATMIEDTLDLSKLETGLMGIARKKCEIRAIFERVRKTLERKASSNKVALVQPDLDSLPEIYCDPEKISRVIINLTINAIKFSDEGKEVRLSVKNEPESGIVRIGVTDKGPGIAPEKVEEIFERFRQLGADVRSSTKGFGLGLNIARELVHLNLGDIEVSSRIGVGSTFSFTVPTTEPTKLITRYLDRVEVFREGSSFVSIIDANVSEPLDESVREDVARFIQHQIRRTDLVFATSSNSWVLVAASNQRDLSSLIRRIEQSQIEANRNRPNSPLPEIKVQVTGTWAVADERSNFVEAFMAAYCPGEALHA